MLIRDLIYGWRQEANEEFDARFGGDPDWDYHVPNRKTNGYDNPRDAFRHAYVAAKFTEYIDNYLNTCKMTSLHGGWVYIDFGNSIIEGMKEVNLLGSLNEIRRIRQGQSCSLGYGNKMDLWNNFMGSIAAYVRHESGGQLGDIIENMMRSGEFVLTIPNAKYDVPLDPRITDFENSVNTVLNRLNIDDLAGLLNDIEQFAEADIFEPRVCNCGPDCCSDCKCGERKKDEIDPKVKKYFDNAKKTATPIALDLDGDGVESYGSENSSVVFDLDGDGSKNITGWINSDDGLLVWDRNNNGLIDNGGELFGENTLKYDDSGELCADGWEALAQEDTNGDGVINSQDANWSKLKVWRDLNQDGISQSNELFTLTNLGITGINVDYGKNGYYKDGNYHYGEGSYTTADGETHELTDVFFGQDTFNNEFSDPIDVPDALREALPDFSGSGALRDLLEACVQSPALQNIVTQFANATTRSAQRALVDDLLTAWANTSGMAATLEDRNTFIYDEVIYSGYDLDWSKVHVVEAFVGMYLITFPNELKPGEQPQYNVWASQRNDETYLHVKIAGQRYGYMNQAYDLVFETVYDSLVKQTRMVPLLNMIGLSINEETWQISLDFSAVTQHFEQKLATDPVNAIADLIEFSKYFSEELNTTGWYGYDMAYEFIKNTPLTDALEAAYNDMGLKIAGVTEYNSSNNEREDFFIGNAENDTFYGGDGNDALFGGDGNDKLYGGAGADYLDGGAGDDTLEGGLGNDVFIYGKGYGNDTVVALDNGVNKHDLVRLKGLNPDDVEFGLSRYLHNMTFRTDLLIRIKETGEVLAISWGYEDDYSRQIQAVEFADGTVWTYDYIVENGLHGTDGNDSGWSSLVLNRPGILYGGAGNDNLEGSSGNDFLYGEDDNDTIYGNNGDDIIDGGAGNDALYGGNGNDVYIFGKGYGNDCIYEFEGDTNPEKYDVVRLKDLNIDDVEFGITTITVSSKPHCNLEIRIKETGEVLTVSWGNDNNFSRQIQAVEFADGTVWSYEDILANGVHGSDADESGYWSGLVLPQAGKLYGGGGNDQLTGSADNDFLYGEDGDDILYGSDGNDQLFGGAGNDSLYGDNGDDILDGGAGDDKLYGGAGNDVFVFGRGYGNDTVDANDDNPDKYDIVRLVGLNAEDVDFGIQRLMHNMSFHDNLMIRIKDTGEIMTITWGNDAAAGRQIQAVEFADGTVWTYEEILWNGLHGFENNDTGRDALVLNLAGTIYGRSVDDTITGSSGNDRLYGEGGNDTIYGNDGDDILDGGAGDDKLYGGAGNDVFVFGRGYGNDTVDANDDNPDKYDIIRLVGLNQEDVVFGIQKVMVSSKGHYNLEICIKDTGEVLTVYWGNDNDLSRQIQAVEFADGTVWSYDDILAEGLHGTDADENGLWTNLSLFKAGVLYGGGGHDVLNGSSGDDRLYGEDGDDSLYGNDGNDKLYGGNGNDKLYGGNGNDFFDGGVGDDYIETGAGNNVIVYGTGYGNDTVNANNSAADKYNLIRLIDLNVDDVIFETFSANSYGNNDLIIRIKATGETLTIQYGNYDWNRQIQAVEFADGTVWSYNDLLANGLHGTNGNDALYLREGAALYGDDGNDTLNGSAYNDKLYGGNGNDTLNGNAGNDYFDGGAGNDSITTGIGNNIIIFGAGYGNDTVNANNSAADKYNLVRLVGLNADDVIFESYSLSSYYNDLIIRIKATGETLTIQYGNYDRNRQIQAVEFADGTVWSYADLLANGLHGTNGDDVLYLREGATLYGDDGNDTLNGSAYNDKLYGGAGNDTLNGGAGNDIIDGGAGNDKIYGNAGADIYVFGKGYGNDWVNAWSGTYGTVAEDIVRLKDLNLDDVIFHSQKDGSYWDLIIEIKETGETLTISNGANKETGNHILGVEFADGSFITYPDILAIGLHGTAGNDNITLQQAAVLYGDAGNDTLNGSVGNDVIYGGDGDDTLNGNAGNDIIDGGAGNDRICGNAGADIYVFGKGYGNDWVNAWSGAYGTVAEDIVRLKDLNLDDVIFRTQKDSAYWDLIIEIKETGETLTISNGANKETGNHILVVEFADGSFITYPDILAIGLHGTAGNDSITLQQAAALYGDAGDDTLNGSAYNDVLYGGAGNDILTSNAGNDVLVGGAGNDTLTGGAGDDTYIFGRGDGQDTINNTGGGNDLLNFTDINPADLWFGKSGNHLTIGLVGSDDKVMVNNWYATGDYKVDTIQAGEYAITESQVALMVQAMAAVGAPSGANGQWTQEQEDALQPILSTYWQRAA